MLTGYANPTQFTTIRLASLVVISQIQHEIIAMTNQLAFHETTFTPVKRSNKIWLTAVEIAQALGYKKSDAVTQIYDRNSDEFRDDMTLTLNLSVKGFGNGASSKDVRVFSLRGAHLIAMFARTPVAKEFRRWVLDILDREVDEPKREAPRKIRQSTAKQLTPLRQTVERLITSGVGNIYPDIWKLVHKRFDIENIQQLPPDQINEAISYLDALEGEYIQRGQQATKNAVAPVGSRRVLLYLDANGSVTGSLPIAPDELVASWNTFAELARREGWIVARKEDFAAKLSNLLM
ncbi:BRO family protein [Pectobacterium polaris]|nr:BRO family protein [Pectobacterium polaris]MDE8755655.1 BRO family protein [Pectobacterium polaris]